MDSCRAISGHDCCLGSVPETPAPARLSKARPHVCQVPSHQATGTATADITELIGRTARSADRRRVTKMTSAYARRLLLQLQLGDLVMGTRVHWLEARTVSHWSLGMGSRRVCQESPVHGWRHKATGAGGRRKSNKSLRKQFEKNSMSLDWAVQKMRR